MSILDPTTRRTTPRLARLGAVAFVVSAIGVASLRLQAETSTQTATVKPMPVIAAGPRIQEEGPRRRTIPLAESPADANEALSPQAPLSAPPQAAAVSEPRFEVASIKRKAPGMAGFRFEPGGRFRMEGPLTLLIGAAYGVSLTGGPAWLRTDDYSVEARAATDAPRSEMVAMLRSLLRDRLKLAVHHETHEEEALALVLARDGQLGPQLRKSGVDCAARLAAIRENRPLPDLPPLPNGMPPCISRPRSGDLASGGMPMDMLASYLTGEVGRRVVNQTGLDGYYELSLRHRTGTDTDADLPSVVTALSEQLGLRLEPSRTTVETIVIDHVERPTEN